MLVVVDVAGGVGVLAGVAGAGAAGVRADAVGFVAAADIRDPSLGK